jgi:CheY-like chemotaxis protein
VSLRVGLCEDDPGLRRVLRTALELDGHEIVMAHTGAEAIGLLGRGVALDVIIMDIGLPDADGRDVCQAL